MRQRIYRVFAFAVLLCVHLSGCGGEDAEEHGVTTILSVDDLSMDGEVLAQSDASEISEELIAELEALPETQEFEEQDATESATFGLANPPGFRTLPGGCHGRERRHTANPYRYEVDNGHLRILYRLPDLRWCWLSHQSRINTHIYGAGHADSWNAVLRTNYWRSGSYRDRLEVYVPRRLWVPIYSYLRLRRRMSPAQAMSNVIRLFYLWGYHE